MRVLNPGTSKRSILPWLSAAVFVVLIGVSLVPMLMGHTPPGFTRAVYLPTGLMMAIWVVAAVGSVWRTWWGFAAAVAGAVGALGHGAILRLDQPAMSGGVEGFVSLLGGILLVPMLFAEAGLFGVHFSPTHVDDDDA